MLEGEGLAAHRPTTNADWKVTFDGGALPYLIVQALPIIDDILRRLVKGEKWVSVDVYNVGGLGAAILMENRNSIDRVALPGGLNAAIGRALYAQCIASLVRADAPRARRICGLAKIDATAYGNGAVDPDLELWRDLERRLPAA